jgi:hypothetical protein
MVFIPGVFIILGVYANPEILVAKKHVLNMNRKIDVV